MEVALGNALQNVVTETAEDAQAGITFLKETQAGRVTFLPLDILRTRSFRDNNLLNQAGVIGLASELLTYDPKYTVAVQQLLGNTVVIENIDRAIELTRSFRPNARLVTLEGELINTSGAVTGGSSKTQTSGLLSRPRELGDLQERIDQLTGVVSKKDVKRKEHVKLLAQLQQTRQTLISKQQDNEIKRASVTKDLEQLYDKITHLNSQLTDAETEGASLHQETEKVKTDRKALQSQLAEDQKTQHTLQRRIERLSEQIEVECKKRDEVSESCQELEINLAGKRERLQGLGSELATLQKNQVQIRESIGEHQEIIDSDNQTQQNLSEQIDEAQRQFVQAEGRKFEAEECVSQLEAERDGLIEQIAEAQKLMRRARREFDKHNRMRHHLEVTTTQLEMQLKAISRAHSG